MQALKYAIATPFDNRAVPMYQLAALKEEWVVPVTAQLCSHPHAPGTGIAPPAGMGAPWSPRGGRSSALVVADSKAGTPCLL